MKAVIGVFYCWVFHTIYQALAQPVLYSTSDHAVIGRPFTLVCTWSVIEASLPNATNVTWAKGNDIIIRTDIKTCKEDFLIGDGQNMTVEYGYLYQSLTISNITSNDTWSCKKGGQFSNNSTITALEGGKILMYTKQAVTDVGSTFTLACSTTEHNMSLTSWFMDGKPCFNLGERCKIDVPTYCDNITLNMTGNCTRRNHTVTFHNASVSSRNTLWSCAIAGQRSNSVRVIALDTGFRKRVTISVDRETGSDLADNFTLTCRGRCRETDNFTWTIGSGAWVTQITSDMEYDRCNGMCSQDITLYTDDVMEDINVTCSVSDNSGRASTRVFSTGSESSSSSDTFTTHKSWHILVGVACGGGAILALVVATVALMRKKRAPQRSSVLETRNVLYEPGEPYLQKSTSCPTKAEMEDNFLYEKTSDTGTPTKDKIVMQENMLYEMEDNTLGKYKEQ